MAATITAPVKQKRIVISGVEVFTAGVWQGDVYTIRDLDDMVRNFHELKGKVDPPLKVGHEENQEFSGRPAVGWVVNLYRQGPRLKADISQIFPKVARLIKAGAYRKVSAEIYPKDEPPEGIQARGYIFKGVAILGEEMPHLKDLQEIPEPYEFNEPERQPVFAPVVLKLIRSLHSRGSHKVFFEAKPMDRKALEDQLAGIGFSAAAIEALKPLSDEDFSKFVLAALASAAGGGGGAGAGGADAGGGGATGNADPAWPDGLDRNSCIAELVAMGEDQAALDGMSDADLIALYEQKKGAMSDTNDTAGGGAGGGGNAPKTVTYKYVENLVLSVVKKAVEPLVKSLRRDVRRESSVRKMSEAASRKSLIKTFCERMVKEAKLSPAQVEVDKAGKTVGPVRLRLERASAVRQFADKPSELELQMAEIEASQPRRFGERIADPLAKGKLAAVRERVTARIEASKGKGKRTLEEKMRMIPSRAAV